MAFLLWQYLKDSAERYPQRPAVAWRDTVLSYAELDDLSTRLAVALRSSGVGPGARVALYMPKSAWSVVAMHGISKAGAAYVPIDPNQPGRRAAFIMKDCGVRAVVTTHRKLHQLVSVLPELEALEAIVLTDEHKKPPPDVGARRIHHWRDLAEIAVEEPLVPANVETDPAYLLYTSGSTGNPKGVILSHRHALTFVDWGADAFHVGPEDRLSNHAPLHFDLSVFDIYVAMKTGACVVMVPDEANAFPVQLAEWIERQGITVWYSVPSALIRMLLHGNLDRFGYEKVRTVLYAGEPFPVKYLRDVMARFPGATFYNLYGPTETNVCTYLPVPDPIPAEMADIPIGRACANTEVFAVSAEGHVIGPGEEGELYVRGPTVLLGYWGLPEKTEQVLVSNPFQSAYQEPAYRTGDIVRLEKDGSYVFVGRKDHMVKSRGYRIELGEIEQALYQHEGVREAVVVAIPDDEVGARLKAVIVAHERVTLSRNELQTFCLDRLPRYMVPEYYDFLDKLPRTSTGKVDRVTLATDAAAEPERVPTS